MTRFILLNVPWGLVGLSRLRQDLASADAAVDPSKVTAPLLFSADDEPPFFNGRLDALEPFVRIRTRLHERQRIWELPVPLKADDTQGLRHQSWRSDISFDWAGFAVSRPSKQGEAENTFEAGSIWYQFQMTVMARMQDFEAALDTGSAFWDFVLERWLDPAVSRDPSMDIVVRHAQQHRSRWADIAAHPRRVLNRRRDLIPISRVQELDVQCMQWISRQPGKTLAERAGGRQRVLALARYENRNTLENRVLRDLLERTVAASREYLALNAGRTSGNSTRRTARYTTVNQYGRECRRLAQELEEQGVGRLSGAPQPNYVLLHDDRYRHVWLAWQEIIHREEVMDDLWRWQRRSWAEFCRVSVTMALLAQTGVHLVAASPLFFRPEHRRGEWLVHDDPLAVIASERGGWVVEILSSDSSDVPDLLKELGASTWLRFSDYEGGDYQYLPVWAVHRLRRDVSLKDLADSANEVHGFVRRRMKLAAGVVCLSNLDANQSMEIHPAGHVTGFAFGPWDEQLTDVLERMGDELASIIESGL